MLAREHFEIENNAVHVPAPAAGAERVRLERKTARDRRLDPQNGRATRL